jgi:hypothetical protein
MIQEKEIEFLFGKQRPGPVPTRSARVDQERVNAATAVFLKTLAAAAPDTPESDLLVREICVRVLAILHLIPAHDRVGIPEGQSDLGDMEGVVRLFTKFPKQFKGMETWVADIKAVALELRKTGKLTYEPKP